MRDKQTLNTYNVLQLICLKSVSGRLCTRVLCVYLFAFSRTQAQRQKSTWLHPHPGTRTTRPKEYAAFQHLWFIVLYENFQRAKLATSACFCRTFRLPFCCVFASFPLLSSIHPLCGPGHGKHRTMEQATV